MTASDWERGAPVDSNAYLLEALGWVDAQRTRSLDERLADGQKLNLRAIRESTDSFYEKMAAVGDDAGDYRQKNERDTTMGTTITTATRMAQLRRERARHEAKLEKLNERLEALDGIPDVDPFPNDTVLLAVRQGYTYAILRAAGYWYNTGSVAGTALRKAPWAELVDWLVDGRVESIRLMEPGDATRLVDIAPPTRPEPPRKKVYLTTNRCDLDDQPHAPHAHATGDTGGGIHYWWCPGDMVHPPAHQELRVVDCPEVLWPITHDRHPWAMAGSEPVWFWCAGDEAVTP